MFYCHGSYLLKRVFLVFLLQQVLAMQFLRYQRLDFQFQKFLYNHFIDLDVCKSIPTISISDLRKSVNSHLLLTKLLSQHVPTTDDCSRFSRAIIIIREKIPVGYSNKRKIKEIFAIGNNKFGAKCTYWRANSTRDRGAASYPRHAKTVDLHWVDTRNIVRYVIRVLN